MILMCCNLILSYVDIAVLVLITVFTLIKLFDSPEEKLIYILMLGVLAYLFYLRYVATKLSIKLMSCHISNAIDKMIIKPTEQ